MGSVLRLGCLDGWENRYRMIIFSGNVDAVHKLQLIFESLSKGNIDNILIHNLDFVLTFHDIKITASVSENDIGLVEEDKNNKQYLWLLSKDTWENYAELLSVFSDGRRGHHYLDRCLCENTKIMVSSGEYPEDWIGWQ